MFCVILDQQGNRIIKANLPSHTRQKFYPSKFNIMLFYCTNESASRYELVDSIYDSNFKLTLVVSRDRILPPGKYIIKVSQVWHQSTFLD